MNGFTPIHPIFPTSPEHRITDHLIPLVTCSLFPPMSSSAAVVPDRRLLASVKHLVGVLVMLGALTAYNFYSFHRANAPGPHTIPNDRTMIRSCAVGIAGEWLMMLVVWAGVRFHGGRMRDLTGGRWKGWRQFVLEIVIAAVFWSLWSGSAELMWHLIGRPHGRPGGGLHFPPSSPLAIALWLILAASAGFCEEAIYRGYLQKQFHTLTGSATFAVLAQAFLFGIGHIYQGYKPVVVIAVLGLEYGLLAHWQRHLRSAMLSHAWSDMVSGYFKHLWGW